MDSASFPNQSIVKLGFWAAIFTGLEVITFGITLLFPDLMMLSFLAAFLLAPTFVTLMVCIHYQTPQDKKIWSHLGITFATIYAVMVAINYYVQLTAVRTNSLQAPSEMLKLFSFTPGSVMFAQDMLGYGFMCLATLAAAPVFTGGRLENLIKWLFIIHGTFLITSLIFPALTFPQDPAAASSTDQFGQIANLIWCIYFAPVALLLAVFFGRWNSAKTHILEAV